MVWRRGWAAALATALLLSAACTRTVSGRPTTAGPTGARRPPTPAGASGSRVRFGGCGTVFNVSAVPEPAQLRGQLDFGCARLHVPVDYRQPRVGSISLQLFRVHDRQAPGPTLPLLVNPGGPGASAVLWLALSLTEFPRVLFQHFDLVAFDPRGTQYSAPIRCLSDAQRDALVAAAPDLTTPAGFRRGKALAAEFARGCRRAAGATLPFYDTISTARDMDRVRQALGAVQLNYLGFSYGTELGSAYAHLFPSSVRVAVLDGAVDPLMSGPAALTAQMQGFEAAFDQFAAWCRRRSPCADLGNPRRTAEHLLAQLARAPLPTGSRRLSASLADIGMAQALYARSLWPRLAAGLLQARAGNGTGLLALADEYYERRPDGRYLTNLFDAYNVISCNDTPPGPSDAQLRETVRLWTQRFPLFGKWSAQQLFMCQPWPAARTVPPRPTAATRTPLLVLGNVHDPATPYRGARDLARTMGNAEVLTWDGQGHTSYLQGSRCVDQYVNHYLISAQLPPDGTVCRR